VQRTRRQLKTTAYHEAGHAVIGRVLTLACGGATIKPNYADATAGRAITEGPYACLYEWEKRGKVRDTAAVWHARIITLMAGAEAEQELLGSKALGDSDDRLQIALMAEEMTRNAPDWDKLEPRLRAMTMMLVRRHRARIERVAEALLARMTLSAKAINRLVGRSIDDVAVNAPWLRVMHQHSEKIGGR
jgi:ATP-dependent Zn protease